MIKILKKYKTIKDKKGFTLIFAILVSVMVLAVGTSIINISLKQVILSSSGRESQFAFYAANTGMECALYWDLAGLAIDATTGQAKYVFPPPGENGLRRDDEQNFNCGITNIATGEPRNRQSYTKPWVVYQPGVNDSIPGKTVFRIAVANDLTGFGNVLYCAEVTVTKLLDGEGNVFTNITSQGLNTCDPKNDARAVQRGLELEYRS